MRYLFCLLLAGCAVAHPAVVAEPSKACPAGYECLTQDEAVEVATRLIMQETQIKHLEQTLRNTNLKLGCV